VNACDNKKGRQDHWKIPTPGRASRYRPRCRVQHLFRVNPWLLLSLFLPVFTWAAPFAYITNESDETVSVIDTATDTLLVKVNLGLGPEGVAANPAGTRVYVANLGYETVSVIDTATNSEVATVPVGVSPFGVAVNSAGTLVYVTDLFDSNVSIIDTATNNVLATVNLGE